MIADNAERDREIAAAYTGNGTAAARLASTYGLSVSHIRKILADQQAVKGVKKVLMPSEKVIDPAHRTVGQRLYDFRFNRLNDVQQAADQMGWSVRKLRGIEKGHSPITLQDLQVISTYMNVKLSDLLRNL